MRLDLDNYDADDNNADMGPLDDTEIDWDSILSNTASAQSAPQQAQGAYYAQNGIGQSQPAQEEFLDLDNDPDHEPEFVSSSDDTTAPQKESKVSDTKKTAVLSIIIGIVIIIACLILVRIVSSKSHKTAEPDVQRAATLEQEAELGSDDADTDRKSTGTSRADSRSNNAEGAADTQAVPLVDQWTPVDQTVRLKTQKTGRFVIIDIIHYGTNIGNMMQAKSVAIGELVGYGTGYEMDLPNDMAMTLRNGDTITVNFKMGLVNNIHVIGDITPLTSK